MATRAGKLIDTAAKEALYVLLEHGTARGIVQLSRVVEDRSGLSTTSVRLRIDQLIRDGLASEHYERGSTIRYISITEKGRKVVEHLKAIDEIMKGD